MKLFYYRRPDGANNFGDCLNPWLWERLMPGVLDQDGTSAFVGIGTLLNDLLFPRRLPQAKQIIVFSSGVGYGYTPPRITPIWHVYCVRGPLSVQRLGLPAQLAIADGAILLRRVFQPKGTKIYRYAFMPHVDHAVCADGFWKTICEQIGFGYIDPRWPTEQVLAAIAQTDVLMAEAMHGAIAADALRVPWIPIRTSARILSFKWHDWCASIGLPYTPIDVIPPLSTYPFKVNGIRSSVKAAAYWTTQWRSLNWPLQDLSEQQHDWIATQLRWIANTIKPNLSGDRHIEDLTIALEEKLDQFRTDVATGKLKRLMKVF